MVSGLGSGLGFVSRLGSGSGSVTGLGLGLGSVTGLGLGLWSVTGLGLGLWSVTGLGLELGLGSVSRLGSGSVSRLGSGYVSGLGLGIGSVPGYEGPSVGAVEQGQIVGDGDEEEGLRSADHLLDGLHVTAPAFRTEGVWRALERENPLGQMMGSSGEREPTGSDDGELWSNGVLMRVLHV